MLEISLTGVLNSYATRLRVMGHSKCWWTPEMATKYKKYGWTQKMYQQGRTSIFSLKTCRNLYYYTARRVKSKC